MARAVGPVHEAIYELVRGIPHGQVMNYQAVQNHLNIRGYQVVSDALHRLPVNGDVPWWRVVGLETVGQVAYAILRTEGERLAVQREILEAEGIQFDDRGRFILEDYRYYP